MMTFRFRAARLDGELIDGSVQAESQAAAAALVSNRALFPVRIEPVSAGRPSPAGKDLPAVLSGTAALLRAGLPVDRALQAVSTAVGGNMAASLRETCAFVREGSMLSSALERAAAAPPLVTAFIRAGERTGDLAGSLSSAAEHLEHEQEVNARLRGALIYPAFVATAGTLSVLTIMAFVVPRFVGLLSDREASLPLTTRLLVSASEVLSASWPYLLVSAVLAGLPLLAWIRTPAGKRQWHKLLLGAAVIGPLRQRLATAQICAALGSLLKSGVPAVPAITHSLDTTGDEAIRARLAEVREDVLRGERISTAMRRRQVVTPMAERLIAFGDDSGTLAEFLLKASQIERVAAQRTVERLVALIEPLLIVILGAVIAFVASALFQAIYAVRPAL